MPPKPLTVSVVTPSYGHGLYIEQTILSVLAQDYPALEYMVVDGGSTDGTVDILRRHESRLRWISEPDRGQADAINKGFARTGGEVLAWLNSDDTYAPGAIAAAAQFLAEHPDVGVVYGDAQFIDAAGNVVGPCAQVEPFDRFRLLHYADFLVQPAVFFRRSVFDRAGGLDASLHWAMDYDLWLKASTAARFEYLPRLLANYRWLGASKTGLGGDDRLAEVRTVARRYGARGLPAYFRLEAFRNALAQAGPDIRRGRIDRAVARLATAGGSVLLSPRAWRSLLSASTWRIIRTGQKLRHLKKGDIRNYLL